MASNACATERRGNSLIGVATPPRDEQLEKDTDRGKLQRRNGSLACQAQ